MIICGCAIEAQYVRQQINEKKTKDLHVGWEKFIKRQVIKSAEQRKQEKMFRRYTEVRV